LVQAHKGMLLSGTGVLTILIAVALLVTVTPLSVHLYSKLGPPTPWLVFFVLLTVFGFIGLLAICLYISGPVVATPVVRHWERSMRDSTNRIWSALGLGLVSLARDNLGDIDSLRSPLPGDNATGVKDLPSYQRRLEDILYNRVKLRDLPLVQLLSSLPEM